MQLNAKQVLASTAAAMLAAVIASAFGEKGTIIGVAIGSVVATVATVLIVRSVERAHRVVRLVVKGEGADLLRRMGATAPAGQVTHSEPEAGAAESDTAAHVAASDPSSEPASVVDAAPEEGEEEGERPIRWRIVGLAMGGAFVLALVLVTCIELIAGRPIATLFGSNSGDEPSIGEIFNPAPTTTVPPTTSTTTSSSSTTTTSSPATTSTTPGSSTTTTQPLLNIFGTTTTTSGTSTSTSTTTTVPSRTTTTTSASH